MSRAASLISKICLAVVLLFSFTAAGCLPALDEDGDDNIGMAVVLNESRSGATQHENAVVPHSSDDNARAAHRHNGSKPVLFTASARLSTPASSQSLIPLRT